jgi:hypothetical protein
MKRIIIISSLIVFCLSSCSNLDLNPLDQGSTESWFTSDTQFKMAVNNGYQLALWTFADEANSDDYAYRNTMTTIISGTLNSEDSEVKTFYSNMYSGITRANAIINSLEKGRENGISEKNLIQYEAEARFFRADHYARLVFAFGDVVYIAEMLDLETAYATERTSKEEVIQSIYDDFDFAIENLPTVYPTQTSRATKGAALALKARYALYFGDYDIAAKAAKACIDLGIYSLNSSYSDLFLTKNAAESIFLIPRSVEENIYINAKYYITRCAGGFAAYAPSWALLASYECTDGLPIDESPLFNPREPFKNRDPRCTATIIEFGTALMGFVYDPHPNALTVMNYNTGLYIKNQDTRAVAQYASFNGLFRRKGIDESWGSVNGFKSDPDQIVIRYADVLLIFAEAKTELNQVDQNVLNAINKVRARAYGVSVTDITNYPSVTTTDQTSLRKILRRERRMEFGMEGLRYYDLIRWKIAEKALNNQNCGMLYPSTLLKTKVVNPGLWFWAYTPQLDEDGIPDFSALVNGGYAQVLSVGNWNDRQYLWPIPSTEIEINDNIIQNKGY